MLCESCKRPIVQSGCLTLDTRHYHSHIATSVAALAQYDAGIESLQERLRVMIFDRSKLQEYVDGCRGLLSPVRSLPAEILCEVFAQFSSPSLRSHDFKAERDNLAKERLLQLSRVCSHWHGLIMGTPRLWSVVDLAQWNSENDCSSLLRHLKMSLERGKHYPLTISLRLLSPPGSTHGGSVLTLLAEQSLRWQFLHLEGYLSALQEILYIRGNLDSLRHFHWTFGWRTGLRSSNFSIWRPNCRVFGWILKRVLTPHSLGTSCARSPTATPAKRICPSWHL
ncbi:hypothetical protein C8R43DRAFT_1033341 [Mycena crocata]|nr:hypothetical protein C8R43DRAFT_1033341 [Mycena crocata]